MFHYVSAGGFATVSIRYAPSSHSLGERRLATPAASASAGLVANAAATASAAAMEVGAELPVAYAGRYAGRFEQILEANTGGIKLGSVDLEWMHMYKYAYNKYSHNMCESMY